MPPEPGRFVGREAIVQCWIDGGLGTDAFGDIRSLVTSANRQPAVACYARKPGDDRHRAFAIDVLRIEDGAIADITTFDGRLVPAFGLPTEL
jgi:RNA polymerase sigma-70 factor (ECF subfamily)